MHVSISNVSCSLCRHVIHKFISLQHVPIWWSWQSDLTQMLSHTYLRVPLSCLYILNFRIVVMDMDWGAACKSHNIPLLWTCLYCCSCYSSLLICSFCIVGGHLEEFRITTTQVLSEPFPRMERVGALYQGDCLICRILSLASDSTALLCAETYNVFLRNTLSCISIYFLSVVKTIWIGPRIVCFGFEQIGAALISIAWFIGMWKFIWHDSWLSEGQHRGRHLMGQIYLSGWSCVCSQRWSSCSWPRHVWKCLTFNDVLLRARKTSETLPRVPEQCNKLVSDLDFHLEDLRKLINP